MDTNQNQGGDAWVTAAIIGSAALLLGGVAAAAVLGGRRREVAFMALENSPNPESPRTAAEFMASPYFSETDATVGIQEYLSHKYSGWMRRHAGGLARDPAALWSAWTTLLTRAIEATGRYKYDAERDRFVMTRR